MAVAAGGLVGLFVADGETASCAWVGVGDEAGCVEDSAALVSPGSAEATGFAAASGVLLACTKPAAGSLASGSSVRMGGSVGSGSKSWQADSIMAGINNKNRRLTRNKGIRSSTGE